MPDAPYCYPVRIEHLFISPGHNYFGKPKDGPGNYPTHDVAEVAAEAGLGLVGDRYFGAPAHYHAQVTFIAAEVMDALRAHLARPDLSPILTRRNIVLRGIPLNQLLGRTFTLDDGRGGVEFMGASPCNPCAWMDAAIAPGAHQFLRGRGGLRARILSDGLLRRGDALLYTDAALDLDQVLEPLHRPRLP